MKQDDLTRIKHVGLSRMRLFNDVRITTIKQLSEMPLEKLAAIKFIGDHYAKLIKNSVNNYYEEKNKILPQKDASAKEIKPTRVNQDLQKKIKRLNKNLYRVNEQLKPLWKKKYLILYIEFRKRSTKLKSRLEALDKIHQDIPEKVKNKLIKKADKLIINLKQVGKKPKKKKYKKITIEIRSFSSLLRDISH